MKKTAIRSISVVLCLVVTLLSLVSCSLFGKKVDKLEIPTDAVYEFAGVQNLTVKNSEELEDETEWLTGMYTKEHYVHYFDSTLSMCEKIDTLKCKDGTITFSHYFGKGSTSFINGGSVYSDYSTDVYTFGTYSGEDVTIDASAEQNEFYKDAYLTEEGFIICVEEVDSDGAIIEYELLFKKIA